MLDNQEKKAPPQWGDDLFDTRKGAHRLHLILRVAAAITLPLRRLRGGRDSPGMPGVLAGLFMLGWAFNTHDLAVLYYLYAWVPALVFYGLARDRREHSRFEGRPWLAMLLTRNFAAACAIEPFIVLGIGYAALLVAPNLGALLLASGAAVAAQEVADRFIRRREAIAFHDAQIEMRNRMAHHQRRGR